MGRIASAIFILAAAVGGWLNMPRPAHAWGEFSHLTVCDLACRNLTDPARDELKKIFHAGQGGITVHAKDGTELRHCTSFNVGCLEEDETPRTHPADHFVNLDRTTTSIPAASCQVGGSCIFAGIDRDLGILKDRSKLDEDRVFAPMAVGHWIGDINQPLQPAVQYCVKVGSSCNYSASQVGLGAGEEERSVLLGIYYPSIYAPIAEDRVRKAEFKLAHLINIALDPGYQGPTKDSLQP